MRLRHVLVPLMVTTIGLVSVQAAASAHDGGKSRHHKDRHHGKGHDSQLTKQGFEITSPISNEGGTVVAFGAINANGQDVVVSDTQDNFVFPDGTLTVYHATVRQKEKFDEKTCTGSFWETGRYVIASGTGQYEGYSGSGEYVASGNIQNGCESQTPTGTYTVKARGSINLPEQ